MKKELLISFKENYLSTKNNFRTVGIRYLDIFDIFNESKYNFVSWYINKRWKFLF